MSNDNNKSMPRKNLTLLVVGGVVVCVILSLWIRQHIASRREIESYIRPGAASDADMHHCPECGRLTRGSKSPDGEDSKLCLTCMYYLHCPCRDEI